MENHSRLLPSPEDANALLAELGSDRNVLADSVRVPTTLMAALGACAAWWVSTAATTAPGADYQPPTSGWLCLVAVLVIVHLIRRETGIRFRTMGPRAGVLLAVILLACLALFSVSLALVSLGAAWAVALTSLSAFGAVMWLSGAAFRSALEHLRRG